MRPHSRLVLGLFGLALAVPAPTRVVAAPPYDDLSAPGMASTQPMPISAPGMVPAAAPHQHKGLFGWRHCVECQRAYVKTHDGVNVPPPPGHPGAMGMPVQGGLIVSGPMVVNDPRAAGYAVVGPGGGEDVAGYAVVGGLAPGDPTPIGVARATQNPGADPRMAAMPARPGTRPYDPSVAQSSLPPAQVAMANQRHDRPHVVSHLFGVPILGTHWREREEKRRVQHAAVAYGESDQKVAELPASMVYGRR